MSLRYSKNVHDCTQPHRAAAATALTESAELGGVSVPRLFLLVVTFAIVQPVNRLPILGGRGRR
jgi:hypothetical protein